LAFVWLSDESSVARSLEQLDKAAEHFGKALGGILMRVFVMLATLLIGKSLPTIKPSVGGIALLQILGV
jgi:hypothetical protein